jgi:hypothetical protein
MTSGLPPGPVVLGVEWQPPNHLVQTGASLAAGLDRHLICAFVDPASYLTEWGPEGSRTADSLDPAADDESQFPSGNVEQRLEAILGPPGEEWSFRPLNGDVCQSLGRLAESVGASMIIVGGPKPGVLARIDRLLEGSVPSCLVQTQRRPVLVVPEG